MFRREPVDRAVQVTPERHAVLIDDPQVAQRDDLVAARIGLGRSRLGSGLRRSFVVALLAEGFLQCCAPVAAITKGIAGSADVAGNLKLVRALFFLEPAPFEESPPPVQKVVELRCSVEVYELREPRPPRRKLIDEFLADPEYGEHFAIIWYHRMVKRSMDNAHLLAPHEFQDWLADQFNAGRGWDKTATEILI